MKNFTLFLIFILSMCYNNMSAQKRSANLDVIMTSPYTNDIIWIDKSFDVEMRMLNMGPDTIRATDTFYVSLKFDTSTILFQVGSGSQAYVPEWGYEIAPGDSVTYNFKFGVGSGWDTGLTHFCVKMIPINSVDTLTDPDTTNNNGCTDMFIREQPNSVAYASLDANGVSIFPNPAHGAVNISFSLENEELVEIQLTDMAGRKVYQNSFGKMKEGRNTVPLDMREVPAGMYIYKLSTSSQQATGKLLVE
jgi:hypothetical protein